MAWLWKPPPIDMAVSTGLQRISRETTRGTGYEPHDWQIFDSWRGGTRFWFGRSLNRSRPMVLVGSRLLQLRCRLRTLRVQLRLLPVQHQLLAQLVLHELRQLLLALVHELLAGILLRRLQHLWRWLWQFLRIVLRDLLWLQLGMLWYRGLQRWLRSRRLRRLLRFGLYPGLRSQLRLFEWLRDFERVRSLDSGSRRQAAP